MDERINRINVIAGTDNKILGRAKLSSGSWANTTDTTRIDAKVTRQGVAAATFDAELTPIATYILDALEVTEPNFNQDSNDSRNERGYNFMWLIPASAFPAEGWYTIEVLFTDASGVTKLLWEGPAIGTLSAGS